MNDPGPLARSMDGWIGCCRRAGQGSRPSPNCRFQGSWAWPPAAAVAAAAAAAVACPSPPRGRPAPRRGLDAARSKPGRARESGRPKPTKAPVKGATQGPRPGTWERLAPQTRTSMEATPTASSRLCGRRLHCLSHGASARYTSRHRTPSLTYSNTPIHHRQFSFLCPPFSFSEGRVRETISLEHFLCIYVAMRAAQPPINCDRPSPTCAESARPGHAPRGVRLPLSSPRPKAGRNRSGAFASGPSFKSPSTHLFLFFFSVDANGNCRTYLQYYLSTSLRTCVRTYVSVQYVCAGVHCRLRGAPVFFLGLPLDARLHYRAALCNYLACHCPWSPDAVNVASYALRSVFPCT